MFSCDACRPRILTLNDALDRAGLVSLPIGRHSLQHGRWRHARPFTAAKAVREWNERSLRRLWALCASTDTDWSRFARFIDGLPRVGGALEHLALLIQATPRDRLFDALNETNRRLR